MGLLDPESSTLNNYEDQDSERHNLYIRIWELLKLVKYEEAEQILDEHLLLEPFAGEAILSWTELKICQGEFKQASDRVLPLMRVFPQDPYYNLAAALFIMDTSQGSAQDFEDFEISLHAIADSLDELPELCADVLAKVAFIATVRGMWSFGMFYFLEAIKAAEEELNLLEPTTLTLLSETNEASLDLYLKSLEPLDGRRVFGYSFEDVSLELLVQTICIFLIAYQDAGIPEAWPLPALLALRHPETKEGWSNLAPLFSRFCFNWPPIQLNDGEPQLPWSVN